jgi:voltage-dependent potassium channel beta subunit
MIYRRLGSSGLKVSVFSIGSWVTYGGQVGDDAARGCILAAVEAGMNFIDNAEAYAGGKAEESVGKVVSELRRESLVLSSKVFWGGDGPNDRGLSRKRVMEACHAALRRLRTDYLDLYFCHRPDPETPIEETVRAMDVLVRQGKVLYWGTSEWSSDQIREAHRVARDLGCTPPTMEQPEYNLFHRARVEQEYAPLYVDVGLGLTTWSPLASGILTGKYNEEIPEGSRLSLPRMAFLHKGLTSERIAKVAQLQGIAAELGCTSAQLALAWCAKNPHVSTVITGASRPEQVRENVGALAVVDRLDGGVVARIDAVFG